MALMKHVDKLHIESFGVGNLVRSEQLRELVDTCINASTPQLSITANLNQLFANGFATSIPDTIVAQATVGGNKNGAVLGA
jgi:hypothetical protein